MFRQGSSPTPILAYGIFRIQEEKNTDDLFEHAVDMAMRCGIVKQGDLTVITAGVPLGISGTTNLIKVHVAGHILIKGVGASGGTASGSLCVCKDAQDLRTYFKRGDIVVAPKTTNEMMPQLKEAAGIIVEDEGLSAHAAIVGLSLDLPVILGAKYATKILKSGAYVTIDAKKGIVCSN